MCRRDPTCSQLLAWMGADVIKFENPQGDATRGQLRDVPNADSLYFTMLNCNKRSITVNMKSDEGKQVFVDLLKKCAHHHGELRPRRARPLRLPWEKIHELNPKIVMGSIKGFGSSGPYAEFKAYENVAQAMGGAMSTTGVPDGPPFVTGAQIGDSRHRAAPGHRPAGRAAPGRKDRQGPVRRSRDDGRRDEPVPRQVPRPPAPDARRPVGVLGADLQGHGRRAARRQRFRRRPARQRDPLQAARPQRLALRRGAGSGVGRPRQAHRPRRRHARHGERPARSRRLPIGARIRT